LFLKQEIINTFQKIQLLTTMQFVNLIALGPWLWFEGIKLLLKQFQALNHNNSIALSIGTVHHSAMTLPCHKFSRIHHSAITLPCHKFSRIHHSAMTLPCHKFSRIHHSAMTLPCHKFSRIHYAYITEETNICRCSQHFSVVTK